MKNIFTPQYPARTMDMDNLVQAILDGNVYDVDEWDVWPFLLNSEEKDPPFTEEDKQLMQFLHWNIMLFCKQKLSEEWTSKTALALLRDNAMPDNPDVVKSVTQSLVAFYTVFSVCMLASYVSIFIGRNEAMKVFTQVASKEVQTLCGLDDKFRATYKTEGLICKSPKELVGLFTKIAISRVLTVKAKNHTATALKNTSEWIAKNHLTEALLLSWERFFRDSGAQVCAEFKKFIVPA